MINKKKAGAGIAELIPHIIAGANIGSLVGRPITQTQLMVLFAVHSRGQCPMKSLAGHMRVSMPTVSGIVDRLVQAGYLQRIDGADDRRQVVVKLSSQGEQLIVKIKTVIGSRWQEVLSVLNKRELENFYQVVVKLTRSLQSRR